MRIIWRPMALLGLESTREHIEKNNPVAARRVHEEILDAVRGLADFPHRGRAGRVGGTRELVTPGTPYIVAYTAAKGEINVIAVLHGARKWPDSL